MGFSLLSRSFFLILFHFHSTLSSSPPPLCAHHQSLSLLQFKQSFSIQTIPYDDLTQYPKTESWKEGTDCCFWDGVTCDLQTGLVTGLDLSSSMLHGTLLSNNSLFSLHHLRKVDLSFNNFSTSNISSRFGHFSNLTHLNLSSSQFEGQVPSEISHLSKLVSLDLSGNSNPSLEPLSFDKIVRNLTKLRELDLSRADMSLVVPGSLMNLSSSLSLLRLEECGMQGKLPSSMGKFKHLRYLGLGWNNFTGSIPYDFEQLTELVSLRLFSNDYLSAEPVSLNKIVQNLTKLRELALEYVNMSLVAPNSLANLSSSLSSLFLGDCGLQGKFPGNVFILPNLKALDLSYNEGLTGSFPSYNLSNVLYWLGLSNTRISLYLENDLISNLKSLKYMLLSNSSIIRSDLTLLGKLTQLIYLDLSNNNFNGQIPSSLGNLVQLSFLDLSNNNLQGTMPSTFSKGNGLQYLNLGGNKLKGKISPSIINCTVLEFLDLRNNKIEDTFPYFLEALPQLQILVLKSNKLQGFVNGPAANDSAFSKLRIFDISDNNFSGPLPTRYLNSLEAMMASDHNMIYMGIGNSTAYVYSMQLTWKGVEIKFEKIRSTIRVLDLSDNSFTGEIPKVIGKLKALQQLNLSHNILTGHIQSSLGILTNLESLDLSSNLLTGRIPTQLERLKFLAILNLSHNQLEGPIPTGEQFSTFNASLFEGNLGLCGFPVLKNCSRDGEEPSLPPSSYNEGDGSILFGDGFGWKAVAMGYGCGFVLGVEMGYVVFRIKKPAWLHRMVEDTWNLNKRKTRKNVSRRN